MKSDADYLRDVMNNAEAARKTMRMADRHWVPGSIYELMSKAESALLTLHDAAKAELAKKEK